MEVVDNSTMINVCVVDNRYCKSINGSLHMLLQWCTVSKQTTARDLNLHPMKRKDN